MIYLDTNILLYATLTSVDTPSQQEKAIEFLTTLIDNNSLRLSNLNLLEYAFVMKKAKEDSAKIESAINLFQSFVVEEQKDFKDYLLTYLNNDYAFKNSFDLYHVIFADFYDCRKIITFDKGFKKFNGLCDIEIEIL